MLPSTATSDVSLEARSFILALSARQWRVQLHLDLTLYFWCAKERRAPIIAHRGRGTPKAYACEGVQLDIVEAGNEEKQGEMEWWEGVRRERDDGEKREKRGWWEGD